MVSLNSTVSCGTMPIAARRLVWRSLRKSWPLIRMAPPVDVVETVEQAGERGFAGPGMADDGNRLARRNGEAEIFRICRLAS